MANYFGDDGVVAETRGVKITGGFTVVVGRLSKAQADEARAVLRAGEQQKARVVAKSSDGETVAGVEQETVTRIEVDAYKAAVLVRGIRSWDLRERGEIATIDLAHVSKMAERDTDAIFVAIKDFDKPIDKASEGN